MTISVSQSFINVTKTHFKNEYRREINNDEIFHKIFELLIFDQKIDNQILYANINAQGLLKVNNLSNNLCLFLKGGLDTMISHFLGS